MEDGEGESWDGVQEYGGELTHALEDAKITVAGFGANKMLERLPLAQKEDSVDVIIVTTKDMELDQFDDPEGTYGWGANYD